jgi:hypothetical protein
MPKQGQHNNDAHDYDKSKGHNDPDKSVTIVTGTPKKQERYEEQARQNKDPGVRAQGAKNEWKEDTHVKPKVEGKRLRARRGDLSVSGRAHGSGSDSNASSSTRGG